MENIGASQLYLAFVEFYLRLIFLNIFAKTNILGISYAHHSLFKFLTCLKILSCFISSSIKHLKSPRSVSRWSETLHELIAEEKGSPRTSQAAQMSRSMYLTGHHKAGNHGKAWLYWGELYCTWFNTKHEIRSVKMLVLFHCCLCLLLYIFSCVAELHFISQQENFEPLQTADTTFHSPSLHICSPADPRPGIFSEAKLVYVKMSKNLLFLIKKRIHTTSH